MSSSLEQSTKRISAAACLLGVTDSQGISERIAKQDFDFHAMIKSEIMALSVPVIAKHPVGCKAFCAGAPLRSLDPRRRCLSHIQPFARPCVRSNKR